MSVWVDVQRRMSAARCRCALKEGMNYDELRAFGAGCRTEYVCPALDKYRRLVPWMERTAEAGWSPDDSQVRRAN